MCTNATHVRTVQVTTPLAVPEGPRATRRPSAASCEGDGLELIARERRTP